MRYENLTKNMESNHVWLIYETLLDRVTPKPIIDFGVILLYWFKECIWMVRIKNLVASHHGDKVFCF